MRLFRRIAIALLTCYLAFLGLAYTMMRQPPERFASAIARMPPPLFLVLPFGPLWSHARAGNVHAGDVAPDFRLSTLDRAAEVSLASLRGKRPVVLIFGSYT